MDKHVVVVGAGPGGLTAAMILAKRGFRVTVFEKKQEVGGRNGSIRLGDYVFDIGPTFLMLKDVLDEVFREAGTDCDKLLDNRKLEPMYRLVFPDSRHIDTVSDREKMKQEIARVFPGHEDRYDAFFNREQLRFRYLFPCLQKSYHRLRTMFSPDLIKALPHLAVGKSLFDVMFGTFGNEQLALTFTFQAKYLGMSPWECPGLFSIIPYIEHSMGIYHPIGGLSRISEKMAETALKNGATINTGCPVKRVITENRVVKGVELEDGEKVMADDVVINADFGHAAQNLFEEGVLRKYTPAKLKNLKLSCSTFMMYLGLDKKYDVPHHAVFFADDYRGNVEGIFKGRPMTEDISFYVRNACATDETLAPQGHSAVYILVPAPNCRSAMNWEKEKKAVRENVLNKLEKRAGMTGVREHIVAEKTITPAEWKQQYDVFEGATFNLAHNMGQMIYLRPHNKFEELDRCYLVGGGTHPGSGLPTIYESGRIAANLISREHGLSFISANLEV